jgi:hypothetical protein
MNRKRKNRVKYKNSWAIFKQNSHEEKIRGKSKYSVMDMKDLRE